jgi:myo-inositol 2-dehydrogenase/D-chiro-inositol 1-dehydrogenase
MDLRVGVIGAGLMGTTHVRTMRSSVPAARVVAVSDAVAESAERLAREGGVETTYADGLELIHDDGVDAVVVASPGDTHEGFVVACLEAGKPVLCEKPLATTVDSARRALEAEAALGRRLVQIGFMRRFDPGYEALKAGIDEGAIGAPLLLHCAHRNPTVPLSFDSEMIVRDSVVHDVDTARWLLGQELTSVTVMRPRPSAKAPEGVQDPQFVVFETDGGGLVDVEAFVNAQYGYDIRCEAVGETGTLALAPPASVELRGEGRIGGGVSMGFQERFASAYARELQAWVRSIADGSATGASTWDGYAAVAVCEAAVESLTGGQRVELELEDRPGLY